GGATMKRSGAAVPLLCCLLAAPAANGQELASPVACRLGVSCFIQQLPDMTAGPEAADPFCGTATYDGHNGTDFRVLSMRDMEGGTDVLAMAAGTVVRTRDGMPDRIIQSEED